jgi:hypothetical protein
VEWSDRTLRSLPRLGGTGKRRTQDAKPDPAKREPRNAQTAGTVEPLRRAALCVWSFAVGFLECVGEAREQAEALPVGVARRLARYAEEQHGLHSDALPQSEFEPDVGPAVPADALTHKGIAD